MTPDLPARWRELVRDVPDFPRPGVLFKDIGPLLADSVALAGAVDAIVTAHARGTIDKVVGIESRGFILGAPVAYLLGAGFVPMRKQGKLPGATLTANYVLEYGEAVLEVQPDVLAASDRVLIVDDVLATGGTLAAAVELVHRTGAGVAGISLLLELASLNGRDRLTGVDVQSLLTL